MMEIKQVFLKTRAEFGKQCIFDTCGPHLDEVIRPDPDAMANYIMRTHCNVGVQRTKQFALHEAQTIGVQAKNSGMFHFEGGWPKEINPKDEETTQRFRRRVEKDEDWAPKLRNLLQQMEYNILQNGTLNIYEHYFDDMIPTELVKPRGLRTVNAYEDPQTPRRPVNDISWSPDSGSKIVVSYCFLGPGAAPDYSNIVYIWQIENPTRPWMTLEASSAAVVSEFNPRDPSVLASGLMSGQVCSWDVRTGTTPAQTSHRQFSHRDHTTTVKWITTKSNTEFFSGSTDGRAMWWDTRMLRRPTEVLVFDLQTPNEPQMDRAIGVSSASFDASVSTKFMFGLENGTVISGSRKARTPADKLALRFDAHYGPVTSVDRNGFNPKIFLTVGDCTARVWAEDTKDDSLVSTRFIRNPVGGCWNKARNSIFYVTESSGMLTVWDLLVGLYNPILTIQLCEEKLTAIAAHDEGALLAVGNSAGNVYLVESTEALYSFDKNERNDLALAIDARLKEIRLARAYVTEELLEPALEDPRGRKKNKAKINRGKQKRPEVQEKLKVEHRERSRIIHRDRKRPRDESPELQKAEEKFFEIVEKEKQKYEEDEDLTLEEVRPSAKRLIPRKAKKESNMAVNEVKGIKTSPDKKIVSTRKAEIAIPTTETEQKVEQEKAVMEETPSPLAEVIVEPLAKKISKRKRRKRATKKRLMPAVFRLPRPCRVGVCRPHICCRRNGKLSTRFADRAIKGREKWARDEIERTRSEDEDVKARTLVRGKDKMAQKKRESWTKLLRAHKREEATRKYGRGERIRFLQEMTAPPEELAEDVRRAKREIQEARRSSEAGMRARKLAKKALKRSVTDVEKSRDTPRGPAKDKEGLVKEIRTMRILAERKGDRVRRTAIMVDPCAPLWEPPPLVEDLKALIGSPLPESIEEKARPSADYSEEIEVTRGRVYPRISEFHSVE